jgi:hypothetical protein
MNKIALLLAVLIFAFATADEPPKFHFPEFLVGCVKRNTQYLTQIVHGKSNQLLSPAIDTKYAILSPTLQLEHTIPF